MGLFSRRRSCLGSIIGIALGAALIIGLLYLVGVLPLDEGQTLGDSLSDMADTVTSEGGLSELADTVVENGGQMLDSVQDMLKPSPTP